ncbi:MAG: AGE family epimerase/isomerase [Propionibacteriaceae bacterium]|nr:AGE family epimerase/isomerase [Propionibacteriaceae bacterium]
MTLNWLQVPGHLDWLRGEQRRLVSLHHREALRPDQGVGFAPIGLDGHGDPDGNRELYLHARMVHCFAIEHMLGLPGADQVAARGIEALLRFFLDPSQGGFRSQLAPDGRVLDETKPAYGNAFALLAGSSALIAGLPLASELFDAANSALDDHFWQAGEGASVDSMTADWQIAEPGYRGQNANMHLTEAYLAAFDATGDPVPLGRARSIATKLIWRNARSAGWRVVEHFDADWRPLPDYNADNPGDQFRPYGATPGHALEWARLLLQLAAADSTLDWALEAAEALFNTAVSDGWEAKRPGLPYTTDFTGKVVNESRMHWAVAEAVGAAVYLARTTEKAQYEDWYREFWSYIRNFVMDLDGGSWWHELDAEGRPSFQTWAAKPDLYHAYQAMLFPRCDIRLGLALAASRGLVV